MFERMFVYIRNSFLKTEQVKESSYLHVIDSKDFVLYLSLFSALSKIENVFR